MKKYILSSVMLLSMLGCVYAQDTGTTTNSSSAADYAPAAGDISAAIIFGRGNFYDGGLEMEAVTPLPSTSWQVPGTAPSANVIDGNDNSITNMVGGEVRYFLMDNIALKLSGGAIIRNTPAQHNVPGIIDSDAPVGAYIPNYEATEADNKVQLNINLGGEYHFSSKYERLFPWGGLTIPFYYGRQSYFDPTIFYPDPNSTSPADPEPLDVGVRSTEIVGFGAQLVGGVDYYLLEGMYVGFEIKPVSVIYAYSTKSPGPGLDMKQSDNTTFGFFSQPFFKVGFRF
jgi:hypothetical protein